jgi:hypothetical protein
MCFLVASPTSVYCVTSAATWQQIQRDGRLVFAVKYLWWLLLHGYLDNPYERAARAAEDPPRGHA